MPSFMIISPHTAADCTKVVRDTLAAGYLTHFDWGCKDGDHTAWAIIEASSKAEVLMAVPPAVRQQARAVEVIKFTPEEVNNWHH